MITYIIRRLLYAVPILLCVMLLTFLFFFVANSPESMAIRAKGGKNVKPEDIEQWKKEKGYNLPVLFNSGSSLLKKGDIRSWQAFAGELAGAAASAAEQPSAETNNAPMIKLAQSLSASLLAQIKDLKPGEPLKDSLKDDLLADLNQTLARKDFFDPTVWSKESLSPEAGELIASGPENLSNKKITRLNRLLLQESFPRLIEKAPKVGGWEHFTQTIFFQKNVRLLWFDFGRSDTKDVDIADEIKRRMGPSLCLTLPNALLGVFTYLVLSMLVAYARGTYFDRLALFLCVIGMSISTLFYIVAGQTIFGVQLKLAPISGFSYDLSVGWKFLMLPIIVAVIGGIGGSTRFYRTVFLEELGRDYIRTARSKGAGEGRVLFVHALRNSMIPIITNVVVGIPMLFFGSLLLESFFAIPGLGGFTVEAIGDSDFSVIRAMVYLGSVLYIAGLILTDICYAWADPRVRLQ